MRHCNLLHFSNHANSYNPSQNFWWRIWKCRHILGCGKSFNSWRRLFHLSFLGSLFKIIWDPQIQTLTLTLFLNSTLHKLICLPKIFQMTNHGCCHILGCEKSCISARAGGRSHFFFKRVSCLRSLRSPKCKIQCLYIGKNENPQWSFFQNFKLHLNIFCF